MNNNNQNQILVQKRKDDEEQEIYSFYTLKTVFWAEDKELNGHEVQGFSLLLDKLYKINGRWNIVLHNPIANQLEMHIKRSSGSIRREYFLEKHPILTDWWTVAVNRKDDLEKLNDFEMLINDFTYRTSISGRNGETFKEAYFGLKNQV